MHERKHTLLCELLGWSDFKSTLPRIVITDGLKTTLQLRRDGSDGRSLRVSSEADIEIFL